MMKATTRLAACATLLWAGTALARFTPSAQQKCDHARVTAWKVYSSCIDTVVAKDAKGVTFDEFAAFAKCRHTYFAHWVKFQNTAAFQSTTCWGNPSNGIQFTDNGDGTMTDNLSGLVWERKDNAGDIHDRDNDYSLGYSGEGTAYQNFLGAEESNGLNFVGFAGAYDWRVPTLAELQTIVLDFQCKGAGGSPTCSCFPAAPGAPCITPFLFDNTEADFYWSATSWFPSPTVLAWSVNFSDGSVPLYTKNQTSFVRAVRGGL